MKKQLILISFLALGLTACQDVLEDEYKNPETVNPPEDKAVAGMFSGMLYQWQLFVKDYGEYWWQNGGWGIPAYTQVHTGI
jgi:Na+/H+ antiporter NhaA